MRYVIPAFQESTLHRGKSLEQFLGGSVRNGERLISWLEVRPVAQGFEVWHFEVPDIGGGGGGFVDVYEFGEGAESPVATLATADGALQFAHSAFTASPERWVNSTLICAEYHDYVKAGRSVRT